jgi:RES domain-containing protein
MVELVAAARGSLARLAAPFAATAWCSGPSGGRLDADALVTTDGNRWSEPGEPTVYLAGDPGVALAEVGRHWTSAIERQTLWRVDLHLSAAMDLRRQEVRAAVGIPPDARWYLDRDRCRQLARRTRAAGCDGIIVPSVAFLDDVERWNAVIFVDRAAALGSVIRRPEAVAAVEFQG